MNNVLLGTAVTIVPGVTTGQLMQFFLDNDVTFLSDVILPSVTYGGVFSGGCHVSIVQIVLLKSKPRTFPLYNSLLAESQVHSNQVAAY